MNYYLWRQNVVEASCFDDALTALKQRFPGYADVIHTELRLIRDAVEVEAMVRACANYYRWDGSSTRGWAGGFA